MTHRMTLEADDTARPIVVSNPAPRANEDGARPPLGGGRSWFRGEAASRESAPRGISSREPIACYPGPEIVTTRKRSGEVAAHILIAAESRMEEMMADYIQ